MKFFISAAIFYHTDLQLHNRIFTLVAWTVDKIHADAHRDVMSTENTKHYVKILGLSQKIIAIIHDEHPTYNCYGENTNCEYKRSHEKQKKG